MVASYEYDGRGFRIEQSVPGKSAPVVTHDYHNDAWQVIEQRVGSSTAARAQFVWSAAYVDALVQEQRDTDANGSLDRTLYATHDANFNVTAAVTLGGIAQQRFLYDAYGARSEVGRETQSSGCVEASWGPQVLVRTAPGRGWRRVARVSSASTGTPDNPRASRWIEPTRLGAGGGTLVNP